MAETVAHNVKSVELVFPYRQGRLVGELTTLPLDLMLPWRDMLPEGERSNHTVIKIEFAEYCDPKTVWVMFSDLHAYVTSNPASVIAGRW